MHLRSFCLSIGLLLSSVPLLAATLPLAPQVLSSQLRIDRHDMAITTEDWHWLRHKAELKVGVYATECAPFSVYAQDNLYEGISADATALVAQLLGLQVKVVPFANEQDARKALQAGSVDVISIHGSTEPRPDLLLSIPYARDRLAVFKRSAEPRHSPLILPACVLRSPTSIAPSSNTATRGPFSGCTPTMKKRLPLPPLGRRMFTWTTCTAPIT